MENGTEGLLWVKEGGSTRLNGELEARRLEMAWRRLFFGEPRVLLIGVDFAVLGDERALRTEGTAGEASRLMLDLTGDVKSENFAGLTKPASLILFFLVGEQKMEGSMFSESPSSKISGARWRLPVDGAGEGFNEDEKLGEIAMKTRLVRFSAVWMS